LPKRVTGPRGDRLHVPRRVRRRARSRKRRAALSAPHARDLRIEPLAPGVVLATFELHNAERFGPYRRLPTRRRHVADRSSPRLQHRDAFSAVIGAYVIPNAGRRMR
jgi:hypothetical protein